MFSMSRNPLVILTSMIVGFGLFGVGLALLSSLFSFLMQEIQTDASFWTFAVTLIIMGMTFMSVGFYGIVEMNIEHFTVGSNKKD